MIERLVRSSTRNPRFVLIATLLLALGGAFSLTRLRFDALPDVTGQQVLVLTRAPGLSPEEVELLVTRPLELVLGGLPGGSGQRSISRAGISSITALFDDDVELLRARQLVQERLVSVIDSLPAGVERPELGPLSGGLGEVFQFTLSSPSRTTSEISELVKYRVTPVLRSVPGIVEVNTWGGQQRTLDIVAEPRLLAQRQVTLTELARAVSSSTGQAPGGLLEAGDSGLLLRGVAWPKTPEELAAAVVRPPTLDRAGVRIGDVAAVREGTRPRLGAATLDGRGETVFVMLQMLVGDNALEVLGRVHARMSQVRTVLPPDVAIDVVYDRSQLVGATLRTVFKNLAEGGVLVVAVLFLLLGSLRAGILVALVIPLSLLGATTCMVAFDIPGNLMSLGALDFGLLVDGGVVLIEALFFAIHTQGGTVRERAEDTCVRMARPVFYSVLMILLVYLPVLSLDDVPGKMFRPMALTVVFALGTALLASLTFVPAAATVFLRASDVPAREPWAIRKLHALYLRLLPHALDRPRAVFAGSLGLLAVGGVLFARVGVAFIPQLDEGDLILQTARAADIRLDTSVLANQKLEKALLARVPEVRHVGGRIGSPAVATDLMGIEQADVFVDLAPPSEWRANLSRDQLIAAIEQVVEEASPVLELVFSQPIQMRFNELVGGSVSDVTLNIYGDDLEVLEGLERKAAALLETLPGAVDVRPLSPPRVGQLQVEPLPLALAQQGLTATDLLDHVQALRAGLIRGTTYDGPVPVPLQVLLGGSTDGLTLESLPIPTSAGSLVPLDAVARVRRVRGASLVSHDAGQRRGVVGFNVRGRDLGGLVEEAELLLRDKLALPEGVHLAFGGQYQSLAAARARFVYVIPLVLALLLGLLVVLFRALPPALLILLNVPFAAVGGIVALGLAGLPLSISATIGFIALSGIAVLNGVVLMTTLLEHWNAGEPTPLAARHAAETRLRPVLMTALVAALGFLPMMLATGAGSEVQRPLATVVVGGLVTSTLLTLIILPSLASWFLKSKPTQQLEPAASSPP